MLEYTGCSININSWKEGEKEGKQGEMEGEAAQEVSKEEQAELGRKQEAPRTQCQLSREYISLTLCFPWAFIVMQSGPRTVYLPGKVK